MELIVGLVVVGFVVYLGAVFISASSGGGKRIIVQPITADEVAEVVDKVNSPAQYNQLEQRLETAFIRAGEVGSDLAIAKAERKADVLQKALDALDNKPLRWQFVPEIELDTPLAALKEAYKVFSLQRYAAASAGLGTDDDWCSITGGGEPDEIDEDQQAMLVACKALRKVVEADLEKPEMIKKINAVVARYEVLHESFSDDDLSPGEQWFADNLGEAGVPKPRLFRLLAGCKICFSCVHL